MLDTTKGWKLESRAAGGVVAYSLFVGIVRTWPFMSRGCGFLLVLLGWVCFCEAVLPDPQLRADPICALLHCSHFLLYWFCRAHVCQSSPLCPHVVTLSPDCRAPLRSLPPRVARSVGLQPSCGATPLPRTPVLTLPALALRALQTARHPLPATPLHLHPLAW